MEQIETKKFNIVTFLWLLLGFVIVPIVLIYLSGRYNKFIFESILSLYVLFFSLFIFNNLKKDSKEKPKTKGAKLK